MKSGPFAANSGLELKTMPLSRLWAFSFQPFAIAKKAKVGFRWGLTARIGDSYRIWNTSKAQIELFSMVQQDLEFVPVLWQSIPAIPGS